MSLASLPNTKAWLAQPVIATAEAGLSTRQRAEILRELADALANEALQLDLEADLEEGCNAPGGDAE
jgi:hypothetical protein